MSKTPSRPSSKLSPFESRLADVYKSAYSLPWTGDVWDYLEKHAKLPHSVRTTRVDRNVSPWIVDPLRNIVTRTKREQTVVGPVQGSKTSIIDLLVQFIITQAPGQTWLQMQKKEAADSVAEKRFMPMLEKNAETARLLPTDPNKRRKNEIIFPHMPFKVQGATANNLQSESVPWMINDEVWLWEDVGFLEMARKRITAVWNGSVVNVSQGSIAGDHLDQAFSDGRMNEWGWFCPGCKLWQTYTWFEKDPDGIPLPGGVRWDESAKRTTGDYDMEKVLNTVHIVCANRACGFKIHDSAKERRAVSGAYEAQNDNPDPTKDSWRWNAMAVYWIELKLLVSEWIKAQQAKRSGNFELLKLFKQQRLAQFWENREFQRKMALILSGYQWVDYTDGRKIEHERIRFMTVDFQRHELKVNVRAWRNRGLGAALLRYETVGSFDDVRAMQLQYGIPNDCVFLDIRFNTAEGARQLTRWQTRAGKVVKDWGWTGVMGEDRDGGYEFITGPKAKPVQRPFSTFNYGQTEEGLRYRYLLFSNLLIKDILYHHRSGGGMPWEAPSDISDAYKAEIDSEYRTDVMDKSGLRKVPRWLPLRKGIPNHAWDTEVHQIVAGCVVGLISYDEATPVVEAPNPVDVNKP